MENPWVFFSLLPLRGWLVGGFQGRAGGVVLTVRHFASCYWLDSRTVAQTNEPGKILIHIWKWSCPWNPSCRFLSTRPHSSTCMRRVNVKRRTKSFPTATLYFYIFTLSSVTSTWLPSSPAAWPVVWYWCLQSVPSYLFINYLFSIHAGLARVVVLVCVRYDRSVSLSYAEVEARWGR